MPLSHRCTDTCDNGWRSWNIVSPRIENEDAFTVINWRTAELMVRIQKSSPVIEKSMNFIGPDDSCDTTQRSSQSPSMTAPAMAGPPVTRNRRVRKLVLESSFA